MGSNPPIRAIPASVAEPSKHIAAFLTSVRPFTTEFASRGEEYFARSRAGGDVLSEEDWRRDYYDAPAPSPRQCSPASIPGHSPRRRSQPFPTIITNPSALAPPGTLRRQDSVAKPGPLLSNKRYSASSNRPSPYTRRSPDGFSPTSLAVSPAHAFGALAGDRSGRSNKAMTPTSPREIDIGDDDYELLNVQALLMRGRVKNKRLPAPPPISPPPEVADSRTRRSVGAQLDALQAAMERPARLSIPRNGILARGVMSQPVKVSPTYGNSSSKYGHLARLDMTAPPSYTNASKAHPATQQLYSPISPYAAERSPHGSVPWSPWAGDSPVSHHPQHQFGRYDSVPPPHDPSQWIDEIGDYYGLDGTDERRESWRSGNRSGYAAYTQTLRPTSLAVDDTRRYRPVSAPIPEADPMLPEREALRELEPTPSIEYEPISPIGGLWERSESYDHPLAPRTAGPAAGVSSWPSTDPVTPVSSPEEVITFGFAPPQSTHVSPVEPIIYNWPRSQMHAQAHAQAQARAQANALANSKREKLPALQTLTLQSHASVSPYSPYSFSPYYSPHEGPVY